MPGIADLARPPAHRGPLIASGAVLVAVGVALFQLRLNEELEGGWHTALALVTAGLILWLAVQERPEGGAPPGHQSAMLVAGLLLLDLGLLRFADVLTDFDAGGFPSGSLVWTSLVVAAAALYGAARRGSAVCALICALATGAALLAAVHWIFDAGSATTYRWLLLLLAVGYIVVSLGLRGGAPRHSEQMVNAAGFAILAIGLLALVTNVFFGFSLGGSESAAFLPDGWELVLFAAGCGLVAYAANDKAPGPAYLGVANLLVFSLAVGLNEGNLRWWPAMILIVGLVMLLAGLRPRRPLPPEPPAYGARDLPLAQRSADDDDVTVRVVQD